MNEVRSCGLILFRTTPELAFLLMKHPTRWDLPKGHVDPGESDLDCALRETYEETGIAREKIELDSSYRYVTQYAVRDRRFPDETVRKTLLIFLGCLRSDEPIRISEHAGYTWFPWHPPHRIQPQTIDPLLADLEQHEETLRRWR